MVAVNASWGLGEAVVAGEVTPDEFWLSKIGPELTSSTISHKRHQCVPAHRGKGTEMVDVPADLRDVACLEEARVIELARIAIAVERHYGFPQDIEWALARGDSAEAGRFLLLQSRPETTHLKARAAAKAARPVPAPYLTALQGFGVAARGETR